MSIEQIVALLVAERDRLEAAIHALEGSRVAHPVFPVTGQPPTSKAPAAPMKRKRRLSAAGRKAIADAAKKRWAAIKARKAESPLAKETSKKAG